MSDIRRWISMCESWLRPEHQHIRAFISKAKNLAVQCGVRTDLEPLPIGPGVQITWMERRGEDRVDIERFLSRLAQMADETGMPLQLSIPGHDPSHESLFGHFGFQMQHAGADLIMQRQPETTFAHEVNESPSPL